jgi:gamma-glutamylcyclotransferase (GGCT)/AIG2-like uncharacterized protein YtfP
MVAMADLHIFVYGTLKPGGVNFDRYCGDLIIASQPADISGELYDLPTLGYPGVIHGNRRVSGFVLSFNSQTILPALDALEDFDPRRNPAENDYNRESIVAYLSADRTSTISAWAYFMNPDLVRRSGGILIPDGWWAPD